MRVLYDTAQFPVCQVLERAMPRTPGTLQVLRRVCVLYTAAYTTATVLKACVVGGDLFFNEMTSWIHFSAERTRELASMPRSLVPARFARAPETGGDYFVIELPRTRVLFLEIECLQGKPLLADTALE